MIVIWFKLFNINLNLTLVVKVIFAYMTHRKKLTFSIQIRNWNVTFIISSCRELIISTYLNIWSHFRFSTSFSFIKCLYASDLCNVAVKNIGHYWPLLDITCSILVHFFYCKMSGIWWWKELQKAKWFYFCLLTKNLWHAKVKIWTS